MSDLSSTDSKTYTIKFTLVDGKPIFILMHDGHQVSDAIEIEQAVATLDFTLEAELSDEKDRAELGCHLQWLSDTNREPIAMPENFTYRRLNGSNFVLINKNTHNAIFHFVYFVVVSNGDDAVVYASPDPVIINKKPPVGGDA